MKEGRIEWKWDIDRSGMCHKRKERDERKERVGRKERDGRKEKMEE